MLTRIRGAISGWRQRREQRRHPQPHRDHLRPRAAGGAADRAQGARTTDANRK